MIDFSVREISNGYILNYKDTGCNGSCWKEQFFDNKEELLEFIQNYL